jgi:signal transduction histidine kinase
LERALQAREAEIEKLKDEKARWVGMAAHDLRHPVGAILAYTDMILSAPDTTLGDDDRSLVCAIRSSTEFMLELINDVFDIASLESVPFSIEPVDLENVVRQSVDFCRPLAQRKKTQITVTAERELACVRADIKRMLQAIANILGNAIKYCPPQSSVEINITRNEHGMVVCVKDNGPGIPADEIDKIFQPFQKTRSRAAASQPGTGLGLAISKRIVQRHGGEIWVESTPGSGSSFFIALPIPNTVAA